MSERTVPLDQFEWERQPHRAHSSEVEELVLPASYRYELLRRNGASDVDILHSLLQSELIRGQRAETLRNLKFFFWDELRENAVRPIERLFAPKSDLKTKY